MAGRRTDEGARRGFGELEQQVLSVLWAADEPLIAREVQGRLDDPPAYTTVTTILDRLHQKGVVKRVERGRAFAYTALVTESVATAQRVRSLLRNGNDRAAVLQGFVDVLSDGDTEELQRLLRQARRKRKSSEAVD
jgi:predicted transcriptional regulator